MGITINNRLRKAMAAYLFWRDGDGDMGELAVALYDLAADYQALLEDYWNLEAEAAEMRSIAYADDADYCCVMAAMHMGHDEECSRRGSEIS